jgi:CRP/FNR family transcriptional regulator, anaerobic regulatory protein
LKTVIPIKTASAWRGTSDCRNCAVREQVLFANLEESDFAKIHAPIDDLDYLPGAALAQEGERALGLFTVRSGMVKLVRMTSDGRERIVRVMRQGDVIGLEALVTGKYETSAVALTATSACRIPLDIIQSLAMQSPRLHQSLMQKWSHNQKEADDWLADLNFGSARQRVGAFILKMRSPSDSQLVTLFSREDMGAMVDLKMETVSREISHLVREGVLEPLDKLGRTYRIIKPASLSAD